MKQWCLEVWGDYACFTRPEMKVERVSYDVITPSSARSIFESILWKPAIKWHITKIEVLNPIRWTTIRRNEVGTVFQGPTQAQLEGSTGSPLGLYIEENRQQRASLILKNVHYRIYAWFEYMPPESRKKNKPVGEELWADSKEKLENASSDECPAKYAAMFGRRAKKGQCFHRPYLGCREFACDFRLIEDLSSITPALDKSEELGWMLYDMNYEKLDSPRPEFFKARLEQGVINTDRRDPLLEVRG
ncbi:MAG TPA: type I-C CRISPR-associated protein Cas5c [Treponemataceae bacterium]|nr:type I-C CRISPR-associated protein Cas5c [Treponemataceae bacterium]